MWPPARGHGRQVDEGAVPESVARPALTVQVEWGAMVRVTPMALWGPTVLALAHAYHRRRRQA